ncbi:MAG: hypothetical protein C4318_01655 [Acidimicrobiia bacterium]
MNSNTNGVGSGVEDRHASNGARRKPTARVRAVGDCIAVAVFVIAGMAEHGTVPRLPGIARNLAVFIGAWLVFSWMTRLYAEDGAEQVVSLRLAATWCASITSGVLVRAVIVGRPLDRSQLIFWVVASVFTAAMLVSWRATYFVARGIFARSRKAV